MRASSLKSLRAYVALAAAFALPFALAHPSSHSSSHDFLRQSLSARGSPTSPHGISDSGKAFDGQTFDYVIVGGGTAGLTVASRLSENSSATVAVIEAGNSGEGDITLTTPNGMLYNSSEHTSKDWADNTVNQSALDNRQIYYPRGKVLGGSSAINGMYLVRQPAIEQESWGNIVKSIGDDAQQLWGWDNMLAAMKKSEHFVPPTDDVLSTLKSGSHNNQILEYNKSSHGSDGNIYASWPAVEYESVGAFLQSASNVLKLPVNNDPDNGNNTGPFLTTSAINPKNWTRSFARSGYLDPYVYRPNLFVLTGHQATKILFDDAKPPRATGVQYAASKNQQPRTVKAKNEVVVSAGVVGTPQLLQLSGVGDSSVLDPVGIKQVANVPGVGFHMQDHLSGAISFQPAQESSSPATRITGDAKQDSFANGAVAYAPIGTVSDKDKVISNITASIDQWAKAYNAPSTVQEGYRAVLKELANSYKQDAPAVEILWFMMSGIVAVQCGLQHPTSQGSVKIKSADAFDLPEVDPAYLLNSLDADVLRGGCKLARQIGESDLVKPHIEKEMSPGQSVQSDEQWNNFIRQQFSTEYHPSSSCAMMPLEHGGCVDHHLRVYNTKGLRVVDASVPPVSLSQHLLTSTYGLAEIAAEVIAKDNGAPANSSGSLSGSSSSSKSNSSASAHDGHKSSASSLGGSSILLTLGAAGFAIAQLC